MRLAPESVRPFVAGALIAFAASAMGPIATGYGQETKTMSIEKVEFHGWKNNLRLTNGDVELIVTLDVGPRILSYRLHDGKNVLKEYEDQLGKSGEAEWQIRGGHRLWTAPEDLTRTYALDNSPVAHAPLDDGGVVFRPAPDSDNGIQKEIEVKLEPKGSRVSLTHRIRNVGKTPTDLAVWALTVMAPGGTEIIPMPPRKPHPGSVKNAKSPADFAPDRTYIFWAFFDFQDPRWHFGTNFITLRQDATKGATKFGAQHREGWVGYLNAGTLFVKRFSRVEGAAYPDGGANFETFTNEDMLEIESLSPFLTLAPGAEAVHKETWELFGNVKPVTNEAEIRAQVLPRLGLK